MLSKRNFAMMMTMIIVVLVMFLSSVVLKEFFNDYDVNHAAQAALIGKKEPPAGEAGAPEDSKDPFSARQMLYLGTVDNGYCRAIQEWADYRKQSLRILSSVDEAEGFFRSDAQKKACLLVDGELLADDPEPAAEKLTQYVEQRGIVIFYRLLSEADLLFWIY